MTDPLASRIDAVVVHFGPSVITEPTLASLRETVPEAKVWIVDNGNGTTLPGPFLESFPASKEYRVLSARRNLGYGAACNLAARASSGDFLLFLNNDVELQPGAAAAMAAVLERKPRVGAVGPGLLDPERRPIRSIGRAPTPRRILFENLFLPRLFPGIPYFHGHHTVSVSHRAAQDVETLLGAVVMVRRKAFEEVGGFDEQFFFYAEESDLFARLREAGWSVRYEPAARAVHHGGVASACVERAELDRRLTDGLRRYARKHHGAAGERRTARALLWGARLRWALAHLQSGRRGAARRRRYADMLEAARTR